MRDEEKFFLRLEEGEQYVLGDRREIEFTVIDGDSPPVYQIDATQSVFGHDEPVNVKLRANIPSAEDKRVDYELVPSTTLPNDILPPDKRIGHFLVRAGEEKDMQVVLDPSANWPQGNHLIKVRIPSDRVNRKGHEIASFTITHTPAGLTPTEALLEEGEDDQTVIVRLPARPHRLQEQLTSAFDLAETHYWEATTLLWVDWQAQLKKQATESGNVLYVFRKDKVRRVSRCVHWMM